MLSDFLVAFDFDGVVWDSVDECFVVGYSAFREIRGKIDADDETVKKKFREGRFLAKTGNDFFITFSMIDEDPDVDFSKTDFEEYYRKREELKDSISRFAGLFYEKRIQLQNSDFDYWTSLQKPYEKCLGQLSEIDSRSRGLVICSTKDGRSIEMLLEKYGLRFPVLGREFSTFKPDQIARLVEERNVPAERIIFVDDLMENLMHVKETGAKVLLADWGYNNSSEIEKAEESGIRIIKEDNMTEQLEEFVLSLQTGTPKGEN